MTAGEKGTLWIITARGLKPSIIKGERGSGMYLSEWDNCGKYEVGDMRGIMVIRHDGFEEAKSFKPTVVSRFGDEQDCITIFCSSNPKAR